MSAYSDLLRDPRWQKKRLERLEAAKWECENCGGKDNTLHVHHGLYVKNRKPWEYDDDDLMVLCEVCYADHHLKTERLKEVLARIDPGAALALLAGYWSNGFVLDPATIEEARQNDALTFAAGFTASLLGCEIEQIGLVAQFAVSITKENSESRQIFKHSQEVFGK